jgi:hypothetical protein
MKKTPLFLALSFLESTAIQAAHTLDIINKWTSNITTKMLEKPDAKTGSTLTIKTTKNATLQIPAQETATLEIYTGDTATGTPLKTYKKAEFGTKKALTITPSSERDPEFTLQ